MSEYVVTVGLADECGLWLSCAVGVADPTAISIDYGSTGRVDEAGIERAVIEVFGLTPSGVVTELDLTHSTLQSTSYHGRQPHGAGSGTFTWEGTDRIDDPRRRLGYGRNHGGA